MASIWTGMDRFSSEISQDWRTRDDSLLFRLAIENMAQGLFMLDAQQKIIVLNRQFLDIYGLPGDIIKVGASARDIVEQSVALGNYPGLSVEQAWALANTRLQAHLPWRVQQRLGSGRVIAIAYAPIPGGGWITTHLDVTEKQKAEDRLAYLANHDALTGLANRLLVYETLTTQLEATAGFAVLCLDLDRFKAINDTLGHAYGDELLRQVADRLVGACPTGALVARLGGDEFLIQFPLDPQEPDAQRIAEAVAGAVAQTIRAPFSLAGHVVEIGTSVGIALAPQDGTTPDMLMHHGDLALYHAKLSGRGSVRRYSQALHHDLRGPTDLAEDLARALAQGELGLAYQPIISLATGRIVSVEGLLRWQHPTRGAIPPQVILAVADSLHLTRELCQFVLMRICREARGWPDDVRVAANLSVLQFRSVDLVEWVSRALASSGLAAHRLELEITESVITRDDAANRATLERLRAMGARICLDDFGTGHASLGYLQMFPFDKIKIDPDFVAASTYRDDCRAIIEAVVQLGRRLGIDTSATGVESKEQLAVVRAAGCVEAQGFFVGGPMSGAAIGRLVIE